MSAGSSNSEVQYSPTWCSPPIRCGNLERQALPLQVLWNLPILPPIPSHLQPHRSGLLDLDIHNVMATLYTITQKGPLSSNLMKPDLTHDSAGIALELKLDETVAAEVEAGVTGEARAEHSLLNWPNELWAHFWSFVWCYFDFGFISVWNKKLVWFICWFFSWNRSKLRNQQAEKTNGVGLDGLGGGLYRGRGGDHCL